MSAALIAALTVAPATLAANQWTQSMPIAGIINHSGGFLVLMEASNPSCGSSGNQFNVSIGQNGMSADGAKSALAVVLAALATERPIIVLFDPAIAGCPIQQIWLKP
jgi:hypothetical protein